MTQCLLENNSHLVFDDGLTVEDGEYFAVCDNRTSNTGESIDRRRNTAPNMFDSNAREKPM